MGRLSGKMALDMISIGDEMEKLVEMFEEADELSGNRQDNCDNARASNPNALLGPGDIGPKKKKPPAPKKKEVSEDIWDADEVPEEDLTFGVEDGDSRPEPEYRTAYKQRVRSEDMFLGIDGKDPGSHCCEDLIVTVMLPGVTALAAISLDVTQNT